MLLQRLVEYAEQHDEAKPFHRDRLFSWQLDITDDGFLSLMSDDGATKDDVKMPESEVGEKIEKLFRTEEKDTSE